MSLYEEAHQLPAVRQHQLTDPEIEVYFEKAGQFEYDEGLSRSEAEERAIKIVLNNRAAK